MDTLSPQNKKIWLGLLVAGAVTAAGVIGYIIYNRRGKAISKNISKVRDDKKSADQTSHVEIINEDERPTYHQAAPKPKARMATIKSGTNLRVVDGNGIDMPLQKGDEVQILGEHPSGFGMMVKTRSGNIGVVTHKSIKINN